MKNLTVGTLLLALLQTTSAQASSVTLKCLWSSYRNFHISADQRQLIFADHSTLPFSAGTVDDFFQNISQYLDNPNSIEQMFFIPYPFSFKKDNSGKMLNPLPGINNDPGRVRYEPFFLKTYGNTPTLIEKDLIAVKWVDGSSISFNKKFGAAAALQKISNELVTLIKIRPDFKKYVVSPLGGTYNWRKVAGSNNLSVHSFGVAIDINLDHTNYWKWEQPKNGRIAYKNTIPLEIVEIFEKNGFIWGGKWYHYDTMHFEYRPELLKTPSRCESEFEQYREN